MKFRGLESGEWGGKMAMYAYADIYEHGGDIHQIVKEIDAWLVTHGLRGRFLGITICPATTSFDDDAPFVGASQVRIFLEPRRS